MTVRGHPGFLSHPSSLWGWCQTTASGPILWASRPHRRFKEPCERACSLICYAYFRERAYDFSLSQCSELANRQPSLRDNLLKSASCWLDLIQPQQDSGDQLCEWGNMPFTCGHFSNQEFVGGSMRQLGFIWCQKICCSTVLLLCEEKGRCSLQLCQPFSGSWCHSPFSPSLSPEPAPGYAKLPSLGCHQLNENNWQPGWLQTTHCCLKKVKILMFPAVNPPAVLDKHNQRNV